MDVFLLIALVVIALMLFMQFRSGSKAKAIEGLAAPDTSEVDAGETTKQKVYFFHATHCRPCKSIMPLVDQIRKDHPNLVKVDVSQHIDLARQFKLAGTPSFYAVDDGKIVKVKLGLTDEQWLRSHLEPGK